MCPTVHLYFSLARPVNILLVKKIYGTPRKDKTNRSSGDGIMQLKLNMMQFFCLGIPFVLHEKMS